MSREEEIIQAADECYPTWEEHNVGFCQGAKWADQHPRKGLWDAEKVVEWIKNNFSCSGHGFPLHYNHISYQPEDIIRDLRKAMED